MVRAQAGAAVGVVEATAPRWQGAPTSRMRAWAGLRNGPAVRRTALPSSSHGGDRIRCAGARAAWQYARRQGGRGGGGGRRGRGGGQPPLAGRGGGGGGGQDGAQRGGGGGGQRRQRLCQRGRCRSGGQVRALTRNVGSGQVAVTPLFRGCCFAERACGAPYITLCRSAPARLLEELGDKVAGQQPLGQGPAKSSWVVVDAPAGSGIFPAAHATATVGLGAWAGAQRDQGIGSQKATRVAAAGLTAPRCRCVALLRERCVCLGRCGWWW